jgi:FkbM family methyltransferase
MRYGRARRLLRPLLRNEVAFRFLRRAALLARYALRSPDEPDLRAFARLNGRDGVTILDVGANVGQSAIALAHICPRARIVSVEPNPALWPDLAFVKRFLGARHEVRRHGLGERAARLTLHVPIVGGVAVTARASLSREEAEHRGQRFSDAVGGAVRLVSQEVEVLRGDAIGVRPDAVKIDVEGLELEVLRGLSGVIEDKRPLIMFESNPRRRDCEAFLAGYGYRFYRFDRKARRLRPTIEGRSSNIFAVPDDSLDMTTLGIAPGD